MSDLAFFRASAPLTLAALAAETGAHLPEGADPSRIFRAAAPLNRAEFDEVSAYFDGSVLDDLLETRAGACLVAARHVESVPRHTFVLVTARPREAFFRLAAMLHPASARPGSAIGRSGVDPSARVDPSTLLEPGVTIDPGAVIGPQVEVGAGTFIGANTVVGSGTRIGRGCAIDAGVTLCHALLGDRVVVHPGARIGHAQDEAAPRARDPHLGRVIVQDDVEIGANATVARGRLSDTILGEGARIGALASIEPDTVVERATTIDPRERRVS